MNPLLKEIAKSALSYETTVFASYRMALDCLEAGIPGDFVECGVYAGSQAAAMALAYVDYISPERIGDMAAASRRIHLFDSFEGIPLAGPQDLEYLEAKHPAGLSACSLDAVKANMARWGIPEDLLVYHPGWFEDTIPSAEIGPIAMLRLDGDLYASTKVCMTHLYPKVSPHGWVVADDYHLSGCRQAINEVVLPGPVYWRRDW